jgi:4-aminobutyrate--pyruvate transaminase
MSGLWCTALGFGEEALIEAATEQMRKLSYEHLFAFKSHEPAIALAEKLKEISPIPVSKVLFAASGSEANDSQVKLIWYYNNARGLPEKKKIISRVKAYHGVTLAATSLCGLAANHRDFDAPFAFALHTDCPHHYRFAQDGESEEDFATRLAKSLEALIERENPRTISAFIAEPFQGAGGCIFPPRTYFEKIEPILKKHDILFIDDEVITGFGRTGNYWGCETYGFRPSTISLAKALTSAYLPLSAVLIPDFIYEAMLEESRKIGTFGHGFTYGGHPVSCAVALKAIELYEARDIVGHVRRVAPRFLARLARLAERPFVGEAKGIGLVGAIELVADKKTKRAFELTRAVGAQCAAFCQARGLIARPLLGDRVSLCPPLVITETEIDEMFDRFERGLSDLEAWIHKEGLVAR